MILAGDVGGTKTRLGLFSLSGGTLKKHAEEKYPSKSFDSLSAVVKEFLAANPAKPLAACFGIPGPVTNGEVSTTNLPWKMSEQGLAEDLGIAKVLLVNDLAATAAAVPHFTANETRTLHPGSEPRNKTVFAVIAPGTGLGQSFLSNKNGKLEVFATEGGHINFSPSNEVEDALLVYLRRKYKRVSIERVVCGPGLANIYEFLRDSGLASEPQSLRERMKTEDPGAVITSAGLSGEADIAVRALNMFVEILGSHVGDMVLAYLATGGVFLGGGIPPRIASKLSETSFFSAIWNKGRFSEVVKATPLHLILDDHAALTGAASLAASL